MNMSVWLSPQKKPTSCRLFLIPFYVIEEYTYIHIIGTLDFTQNTPKHIA